MSANAAVLRELIVTAHPVEFKKLEDILKAAGVKVDKVRSKRVVHLADDDFVLKANKIGKQPIVRPIRIEVEDWYNLLNFVQSTELQYGIFDDAIILGIAPYLHFI